MQQVLVNVVLAVACAALVALTIAVPDWIEAVFGVDPDAGSGALEWLICILASTAALGFGRRAVRAAVA